MSTTVLAGEHIVSADTICDLERSLYRLGAGVSRTAYDLGNGSVLKVGDGNGWAGGNETEVQAWLTLKDSEAGKFLAPIIAWDEEQYAWLIMKKMDGTLNDSDAARAAYWETDIDDTLGMAGINDLHGGNVGFIDDGYGNFEFYAIDYAMNENRDGAGACDSDTCHGCSFHPFRRSDACCSEGARSVSDCSDFSGCRFTWCDRPQCGNRAVQAVRSWVVQTNMRLRVTMCERSERAVLCAMCAPVAWGDRMREQERWGQGHFVFMGAGRTPRVVVARTPLWKRSCDSD